MFNIRVAIVQPGIIDTAMVRRTGDQPPASLYAHMRRMAGLFTASLYTPVSPLLVGQKILDIIDSGPWQLRHPVGPDAASPSSNGAPP
jgi:NAD(P)-dependent dehydrogenase (short-subunit alcohol dehydrogenase family)